MNEIMAFVSTATLGEIMSTILSAGVTVALAGLWIMDFFCVQDATHSEQTHSTKTHKQQ